MKNHYQSLGVKSNATLEEIKTSYRKLALKFHPDKNDGDSFFLERFRDIQEAYEILSNSEKRKHYDNEWNNFVNPKKNTAEEPTQKKNTESKQNEYKHTEYKRPSQQYTSEYTPKETKSSSSFVFVLIVVGVISFYLMMVKNKSSATNYENNAYDSTAVEAVDTVATDFSVDTAAVGVDTAAAVAAVDEKPAASIEHFRDIVNNREYTRDDLVGYLDDYYGFYRRDYVYRNPIFKKYSDSEFEISLEECPNDPTFKSSESFWDARVLKLEIDYDGKYKIRIISY